MSGGPSLHDARATAARLPYGALVDAIATAAVQRADGRLACPERLVVPLPDGATLLSMPAVAVDVAIHKLITVAPNNRARGLPPIQGHMTLVDPSTGTPTAIVDGPTVTGRRTAAVSMLAIRLLAPGPVARVRLIGTGSQAAHHVDALATLMPDVAVDVVGRNAGTVDAFVDAHRDRIAIAASRGQRADVVVACTTSRVPVHVEAADARTLVVAVGSFRPDEAEVAAATVRASAIVVDDPAAARHEAGDLLMAGIDWSTVRALADVVGGVVPAAGPRLFKSVGCAAWDLAAARVLLASA